MCRYILDSRCKIEGEARINYKICRVQHNVTHRHTSVPLVPLVPLVSLVLA